MSDQKTSNTNRIIRLRVLLVVAVALLLAAAALFVGLFRELPVIEALYYIRSAYFDYNEESPKDFTENVLKAIAYSLEDDYSDFYSAEEYEKIEESKSGSYVGIGVVLTQHEDGTTEITTVYAGSSAEYAGVLPGDVLVSANGKSVDNMLLSDIISCFDMNPGFENRLGVLRNANALEICVSAGRVYVPYATSKMLTEKIGYIRIAEFNGNAASETRACVDELMDKNTDGLVIDLRDNPGGDLDVCLDICSIFLKKGDTIVSTRSRKERERIYSCDADGIDIPTVILINGGSASAAELMTAALHDNGRACVIGTRSFGKGIVQTIFPLLSNGGRIKFTTEKYFTPAGKCIHGEGIQPDILIEPANEENAAGYTDAYLDASLAYFRSLFD